MCGVFHDGVLVGFCGLHRETLARTRHRAELGPFLVAAKFQGSGAAGTLMQVMLAEARASGVEQVELFVDTRNARAIAFYERHGFTRIATHLDSVRIDGQPHDDHFYVLRFEPVAQSG